MAYIASNSSAHQLSKSPSRSYETLSPKPASTSSVSILDLPQEILEKLILNLVGTSTPRNLNERALAQAEDAHVLASTCTTFRHLFRQCFEQLTLEWNAPVNPNAIARLFGNKLRKVHVHRHPRADLFLDELATASPNLESLALWNCPVSHAGLHRIVACSASVLRSIDLQFVIIDDVNSILCEISSYMRAVNDITLRCMSGLEEEPLIRFCHGAGPSLQSLSLRYLRNLSVKDSTLQRIAEGCPSVQRIELEDLRHCTPDGVVSFCGNFKDTLTHANLVSFPIKDQHCRALVLSCPRLQSLGLEESTSNLTVSNTLEVCKILGKNLHALRLYELKFFYDEHVTKLVSACSTLQKISLRRHEHVTDTGIIVLCQRLGNTLTSLNIKGCFVTDDALRAIGAKCPNLSEVFLGGDGQQVSRIGVQRLGDDAISNAGMDALLRGTGKALERFSWETPYGDARTLRRGRNGLVGVANLSPVLLAKSLAEHCRKLKVVHVVGLRPPLRERVNRARCDLAFMEMEERLPDVVLYIDRPERV